MKQWSNRFNSRLDECMHIVLALHISNIYSSQEQELIDNYGETTVREAVRLIERDYSSIIKRFN